MKDILFKKISWIILAGFLLLAGCSDQSKTRVLVITGGHEFDHEHFMELFESLPDVAFYEVTHPDANDLYACDSINRFDVLVFYDLVQDIREDQKAAFIRMLEKGKGVVFLHHSIASYQDWDKYLQILGGRYYLDPRIKNGDTLPASTYTHGQDVQVQIADTHHPVTKGLKDFDIHDETYNLVEVLPRVHPLLKTDHPESGELLAWTNEYANSCIVYIQMGHDNNAYSNPNYRTLVKQAIEWVK